MDMDKRRIAAKHLLENKTCDSCVFRHYVRKRCEYMGRRRLAKYQTCSDYMFSLAKLNWSQSARGKKYCS